MIEPSVSSVNWASQIGQAVAVILFATPPKNAKATAYSVLGGHLIAAIAALLQLAVLPAAVAFAAKTVIVSLVVLGMKLADAVHPPACAFAMLFVVGKQACASPDTCSVSTLLPSFFIIPVAHPPLDPSGPNGRDRSTHRLRHPRGLPTGELNQ